MKLKHKCIWNRQENKIKDLIICWTIERGNSRLPTARAVWLSKTNLLFILLNHKTRLIQTQSDNKNWPWVGALLCFHFCPSQLARTIPGVPPCRSPFHSRSIFLIPTPRLRPPSPSYSINKAAKQTASFLYMMNKESKK